jgi:hypothetical protein
MIKGELNAILILWEVLLKCFRLRRLKAEITILAQPVPLLTSTTTLLAATKQHHFQQSHHITITLLTKTSLGFTLLIILVPLTYTCLIFTFLPFQSCAWVHYFHLNLYCSFTQKEKEKRKKERKKEKILVISHPNFFCPISSPISDIFFIFDITGS